MLRVEAGNKAGGTDMCQVGGGTGIGSSIRLGAWAIIVVLFEVHPRVCSDCSSAVVRGAPFWW